MNVPEKKAVAKKAPAKKAPAKKAVAKKAPAKKAAAPAKSATSTATNAAVKHTIHTHIAAETPKFTISTTPVPKAPAPKKKSFFERLFGRK